MARSGLVEPVEGVFDINPAPGTGQALQAAATHYICVDPSDNQGALEVLTQAHLDRMDVPMRVADNNLYPISNPQCETRSIQQGLAQIQMVWNTGTPGNPVIVYFPAGVASLTESVIVPANMIFRTTGPGPTVFFARNFSTSSLTDILQLSNSNSQVNGSQPLFQATDKLGGHVSLGRFAVLDFIGGLPAAVGLRASGSRASGVDVYGIPIAEVQPGERFNALAGAVEIDAGNIIFGDTLLRNVKPSSGLVRIRSGAGITISQVMIDNPSGTLANGYDGNMGFGFNIQPRGFADIQNLSIENITITHAIARFGAAVYMSSDGSTAVQNVTLRNLLLDGRGDYGIAFYVFNGVKNIRAANIGATVTQATPGENPLGLGGLFYVRATDTLNPGQVILAHATFNGSGVPFYINNLPSLLVFGCLTVQAGSFLATGPFPDIGDQNVIPQTVTLKRNLYQGSLVTPGSSSAGTTIDNSNATVSAATVDSRLALLSPKGLGPTKDDALQELGNSVALVTSDLYGQTRWSPNPPAQRADHGAVAGSLSACPQDSNGNGWVDVVDLMVTARQAGCQAGLPALAALWHQR